MEERRKPKKSLSLNIFFEYVFKIFLHDCYSNSFFFLPQSAFGSRVGLYSFMRFIRTSFIFFFLFPKKGETFFFFLLDESIF